MIDSIIKEGMNLDFPEGSGMIINTDKKDDDFYINVAFGEGENIEDTTFKIYQVIDKGDNVDFAPVSDEKLAGELNAEWIAREMLDNGVE